LDRELDPSKLSLLNEDVLWRIWYDLHNNVPEDALGLQAAMRDIQNCPDSADLEISALFRKLAERFFLEFKEAGILINGRIPCSCSEYATLQNILEKKWTDETVLAMWGDAQGGLVLEFEKIGAFKKRSIPKRLSKIRAWLNRSKNQIYLNRVTRFDVSKMQIKVCPQEINKFHALETLDLRANQLRYFSNDLTPCAHLKVLNLYNNKIQRFDPNLSCNSELECLDVSMNCLHSFNANLRACTNLKLINLSFNRISEFSSDLRSSKELDTLNLNFNKLLKFPDHLLPEKKPKHLYLSRNLMPPRTPKGFKRMDEDRLAPPLPKEPTASQKSSPKPERSRTTC